MTIEFLEDWQRPNFHSYADATWRDLNNNVHQRYTVMVDTVGFKVVDTMNGVTQDVQGGFVNRGSAQEWMQKTRAPQG
jgi:hypothetical protein